MVCFGLEAKVTQEIIKKCCSTSDVGIGQVNSGILYIRLGEAPRLLRQIDVKLLLPKPFRILLRNLLPE